MLHLREARGAAARRSLARGFSRRPRGMEYQHGHGRDQTGDVPSHSATPKVRRGGAGRQPGKGKQMACGAAEPQETPLRYRQRYRNTLPRARPALLYPPRRWRNTLPRARPGLVRAFVVCPPALRSLGEGGSGHIRPLGYRLTAALQTKIASHDATTNALRALPHVTAHRFTPPHIALLIKSLYLWRLAHTYPHPCPTKTASKPHRYPSKTPLPPLQNPSKTTLGPILYPS